MTAIAACRGCYSSQSQARVGGQLIRFLTSKGLRRCRRAFSTAPIIDGEEDGRRSRRLNDLRQKISKERPTLQDFLKEAAVDDSSPPPSPSFAPSQSHRHQGKMSAQTTRLAPSTAATAFEEEGDEAARREAARKALVDSFGRHHNYLRISITERCNLRCTYCMPADGVPLQPQHRLLSSEEIIRLAEIFVGLGVDKIRLTGGEPLVRKDVVPLVRSLKELGIKEIAVTTNGVAPWSKFDDLVQAGMTHFNVSLDTLQPERFASVSRRSAHLHSTVLSNITRLLNSGLEGKIKVNNVIMRGFNDDELIDFGLMTRDRNLEVRFIEWMPFDSNGWNGNTFFSYQEMIARIQEHFPDFARDADGKNDTTKWYRIPGHKGRIGFITSMSQHFCGSCNRLRITADGKLKVCLFGAEDLSLRDALREGHSKEELIDLIGAAVFKKKFSLGGQADMYSLAKSKNRPMILIGG